MAQLSRALSAIVQDMDDAQMRAHLSTLRRDIRRARAMIREKEKTIAELERPPAMQRRRLTKARERVRDMNKAIRLRIHRIAATEALLAMMAKARRGEP